MSIAEKLTTIAENEQKVFDAGKQAEYDAFWDVYQENGNRTDYERAFSYRGWNQKTLKPKYKIQPTRCPQMFYQLGWDDDNYGKIDLRAETIGVEIDFSKSTNMNYCFQNARISHLGVIDLTSCPNVNVTFCNMYWLHSIEKIIVNENNVFDSNCFSACGAYEIRFEGVIASDIRLNYVSNLSKATIESVINTFSPTVTGKTFTLKSAAVTNAFGSTNSDEWKNLIATKPNLTITLV